MESLKFIRLISLKENVGLGPALNIGLRACICNLICRFDTDDISLANRLKETKKAFIENPNLQIFSSSIIEFIETKRKYSEYFIKDLPLRDKEIKSSLEYRNSINHPSVVFKKDAILNLGGYDNIKFFEDYYLWLKARKHNYIFSNISIPLVLMKRVSYTSRRQGITYALYEYNFFNKAIRNKLLKIWSILFFILRILSRIIPERFDFVYRLIPWRKNNSFCLNPLFLDKFTLESIGIKNNIK